MKAAFLIAAPHSGSGKTTIARGLMALFHSKGYIVQPFKCGPDYIDTKFHEAVCGRPSVNLDSYFASPIHLQRLFLHYTEGADIAIAEGMMGLFDGFDRDRGSSAEIARLLSLPVLLVVDAASAAYSMAALLQGFTHFRPDVRFLGVVFNKVGSPRHAQMLRQVCEDLRLPCLGCLPKNPELETPSRYLGLDFSGSLPLAPCSSPLAPFLEEHLEWETMLRLSPLSPCSLPPAPCPLHLAPCPLPPAPEPPFRTLVARNAESFSFIYRETLDRLAALGPVCFFDPETDVAPSFGEVSLLYLPGGYPERHLPSLSAAASVRRAVRDYAERGGRVLAECGGMMYLTQSIATDEGCYPMCGVLPCRISARKADRHLSLGYRHFCHRGAEYRGHEFHYTQVEGGDWDAQDSSVRLDAVFDAKGLRVPNPIVRRWNVIASYTHLYWGEQDPLRLFE
ncbi:MAG: cobyrinate a,c-diamide synthase [Bacteroidaceae bacterium]|nr:cobyrinate a,c-diamide synthase [Bacteroidaceae bacterium]